METIIIQDTSEDILEVMSLSLQLKGYKVHVTKTLDERLLELIDYAEPHVVLVDYKLHGEDAIHICHLVRAFYPNMPVIAMSCNTNIHKEYKAGGFDDYLDKPFELESLYNLIRKFIPVPDEILRTPKHIPNKFTKSKSVQLPLKLII